MQSSRASRVHLSVEDTAGYRRSVLQMLLVLTMVFGAIFVLLNIRAENYALAVVEACMGVYAALLWRRARHAVRLEGTILAFLLPFFVVMMYALLESGTDPSIYCWALVVPVLSYLLLGRRAGLAVSVLFLSAVAAVFFARFGARDGVANIDAIVNVLLCALSILGFAHVYERSRARTEARLQQLAVTDPLTGLHNREWFRHAFEIERSRVDRRHGVSSLLVLDLDHFKRVNDRFGHDGGDQALCFVADVLSSRLRASDTFCRLGGEEFVVVLPDTTRPNARVIAESLRKTLAGANWRCEADEHHLTVSIGVAEIGADGCDLKTVFGVADTRLYQAKLDGRDRVVAR